jgi:hypothetical protein
LCKAREDILDVLAARLRTQLLGVREEGAGRVAH